MSIILKAENISKQYRLGIVGTGTMSDDLKRWWYNIRGKEDPFLKVGGLNDRSVKATEDYVWALRDINFEVKQGEVLGIIGKNGAGKSTLLKLLSRVTSPTTGTIKTKGRIASLLEIGTGFHPELTGRENIFMNGAVLGMTKNEIKKNLDEIIDFSGCEMYIDTPVKRYSSGMTVRLGFAVAAHLEPEILVIDEVLAVGDAEFQKKAIGKMQDLSIGQGRTVLFVSHNMASVETLCNRVISLDKGQIHLNGSPNIIISDYLQRNSVSKREIIFSDNEIGEDKIRVLYGALENALSKNKYDIIDVTTPVDLRIKFINQTSEEKLSIGFDLRTNKEEVVFGSLEKFECKIGIVTEVVCRIPANFLNNIFYRVDLYFHTESMHLLLQKKELLLFEVKDVKRHTGFLGEVKGVIRPQLNWAKLNPI